MELAKKLRLVLLAKGMNLKVLAAKMEPPTSPSNITNKLQRDNLTQKDLLAIAKACDAKLEIKFILDNLDMTI